MIPATGDSDRSETESQQVREVTYLKSPIRREVTYLGHTILADGVSCESGTVECVQNWLTPTTTTELCSFFVFASYYRRFIRIAGPLHGWVKEPSTSRRRQLMYPGFGVPSTKRPSDP